VDGFVDLWYFDIDIRYHRTTSSCTACGPRDVTSDTIIFDNRRIFHRRGEFSPNITTDERQGR
jgi:hypothetical protein